MPRDRPDLTGAAHRKRRATALATGVCIICGKPINPDLPGTHPWGGTLEHVIPVSRGGHPTHPDNLAASHRTCNYQRGTKLLSELPPRNNPSRNW